MFTLRLQTIRTPHEHFDQVYQLHAFETAIGTGDEAFRVVAPIELSFDVDKDKDQFRLAGHVRTTVELTCSRCLEPTQLAVDAPFDLRYRPFVQPKGGSERQVNERQIEEDDFETAQYENDEIDLAQLILERLHLALPMKPLCSDDCRGLCPLCGTNLNRQTCECKTFWDDPRFAALKGLKN